MVVSVQPIDGGFAREAIDIRLWEPISCKTKTALRKAYRDHPLLVFRRQSLEETELVQFAKLLGTPVQYEETKWQGRCPEIVYLSNMRRSNGNMIGGLANQELTWHTDQSWKPKPITGNLIYAIVVPSSGGKTSWADLYGAYEALPKDLRKIVDEGVGTFSYASRARHNAYKGDNVSRDERVRSTPDVKHRLVNIHPVTGRRALYIDPDTVIKIDGIPDHEAIDILDSLLVIATRKENIYQHDWHMGDLVLWDNACLLHRRDSFPSKDNRMVLRMMLGLPTETHIAPLEIV